MVVEVPAVHGGGLMTMIAFTDRQRAAVETFMLSTRSAKERCRAQALLLLDEGETVEQVAGLFHVSRQTVYNWVERFQLRRGPDLRSHLADAPRRGRPPTALGVIDPLIAEVIDGDPRDLGYHATVWTAPLLREYLKQVHGIEVSRKSVSLALDRLRVRWKRPRHQLALRPRTWRQAKGG
jgi:transposase